ncbi:MAG: flagellar hook-basal body complex protein, partial [Synergistaceae bacterium]|jgi:flagellar hook-basal body protein|nr:flagellar hook-basal body complex protein [Synergistaceae bacterium]
MAIQGSGFFIVKSSAQTYYTRAGNFTLDRDGNLVMAGNGYQVQGYAYRQQVDPTDPTKTTLVKDSNLSTVNITAQQKIEAQKTNLVAFRSNLDSRCTSRIANPTDAAVVDGTMLRPHEYTDTDSLSPNGPYETGADTTDPDGQQIRDFGLSMMTEQGHDHETKFTVYDSLGDPITLVTAFRKVLTRPADTTATPPTAAETEWDWYSYYADADGNPIYAYGEGAGTIVFGDDGLLKRTYYYLPTDPPDTTDLNMPYAGDWVMHEKITDPSDPNYQLTRDVSTAKIIADFNTQGAQGSVTQPVPPGYTSNTITLDFLGEEYWDLIGVSYGRIDGVTGFGSTTTTKPIYQDGYAMGILQNYSVGQDGVITGAYSNGKNLPIAQVALAMFANPGGLTKVGDTCFAESTNSGIALIQGPMEGGSGSIASQTIEMSNVDLSEEFVNLIRAQRGFQANTRVVTTSDQVLEELINMKR